MSTTGKADSVAPKTLAETIVVVRGLQHSIKQTESRLQHVEEAGRVISDTQRLMDEKVDSIHKMLSQWNTGSKFGSSPRPHHTPNKPAPLPPEPYNRFSPDELAFLKKQEAAGKISLHIGPPHTPKPHRTTPTIDQHTKPRIVYTDVFPSSSSTPKIPSTNHDSQFSLHHNSPQQPPHPNLSHDTNHHYSISIARPKLNFPSFSGEQPFNWLRQCKK
jgi:hypothetical protein